MVIKHIVRITMSSPRPWGCFHDNPHQHCWAGVFPTPVGVFPSGGGGGNVVRGLPHARGGVSLRLTLQIFLRMSSPRPWGCFRCAIAYRINTWVFPTPVGVFLPVSCGTDSTPGLPHARGGVSVGAVLACGDEQSSPRPWGCFYSGLLRVGFFPVFPTPVGVFLAPRWSASRTPCLPHARGGCFPRKKAGSLIESVFPTPVGVFPARLLLICALVRLPHARGGVSGTGCTTRSGRGSSPRPWGCFRPPPSSAQACRVFPTPVGVFLI